MACELEGKRRLDVCRHPEMQCMARIIKLYHETLARDLMFESLLTDQLGRQKKLPDDAAHAPLGGSPLDVSIDSLQRL